MSIKHFYVPAPGQTNAEERAIALEALLADTAIASSPRYVDRIPSLPAVVCDHGDDIVVIPEPTTLAEVRAAHDELLREHLPADTAYVENIAEAVAVHTSATNNPHGITPQLIGAATPADIDTRLAQVIDTAPAALDTLNELAAAIGDDANFASTVTTQLAGKASTTHNHDSAYTAASHAAAPAPHSGHATTGHNHDTAYSAASHGHSYAATTHSHVLADLPSTLATDAEVAAGYATTGHTHGAAAPAAHAANHASAGTDVVTPAAIGAAASSHTHSYAATSHSHVDADLPAGIARDTEVSAAITAHEGLADPHPTYLTQTEGDARYALLSTFIPSAGVMRVANAQTMTATAQTAVTGMSFAAAANATYYFVMSMRITTSTGTAPTTAWGVTGPASPTAVAITIEQDTSTSVEQKALLAAFGAAAAGAQVANTGAEIRGVVQTTAAGTVQLTAARGGTTPSMVVAAGSNGFWLRVA